MLVMLSATASMKMVFSMAQKEASVDWKSQRLTNTIQLHTAKVEL